MLRLRNWACAVLASACVGCAGQEQQRNLPVLDVDFPDPFVMPTGDGLVAYATNTDRNGRINVQMSRSRDGTTWSLPTEAMPRIPPWSFVAEPSIWAPEVMRIGDRYVLYFSARHATRMRADGRTLCIGAAVSAAAHGPFLPQPLPLTCGGEHGVIDVSPFRDGEALWLHFKTDGNCCATPTKVQAQRLDSDGLSLVGEPTLVQGMASDAAWEGKVIEAPQMLRANGRYWMFYAGNDYGSSDYATGYAICGGPTGPCRDAADNPILKSTRSLIGPGHPSVFQHEGATWIAFHGWRNHQQPHARYRAMYIEPLRWSEGRPAGTGAARD